MIKKTAFAVAVGLMLAAGQASAFTIDFSGQSEGDTIAAQFVANGATFLASPLTGASLSGSAAGAWATNTDMTVTSTDVGGFGTPSLVAGNLLHAFGNTVANGWLSEDGDPNFKITFASAMNFFSADFAGIAAPAQTRVFVYDGATLLTTLAATTTGQQTLSYSAPSITSVIVAPGSFDDWVGVDNITFTAAAVPEVSTYAMMALGIGLIAFKRRKAA